MAAFRFTEEHLKLYFQAMIEFIPLDKLQALFEDLGYDGEEITADLCMRAQDECGLSFGKPFAQLAREVIRSDEFKLQVRAALQQQKKNADKLQTVSFLGKKITRFTGKKNREKGSTEEKNGQITWTEGGISALITAITGFVNSVTGGTSDIIDSLNSDPDLAKASLLKYQSEYENSKNNSTTTLLLFGVGAVVLILIVIIVVVMLKK